MLNYVKTYTRENCLIAMQIWEEQQAVKLKEKFGVSAPLSIFDAYNGVVDVYYDVDMGDVWANIIANKANSDKNFVPDSMKWYGENLDKLEKIWNVGKLSTREELVELYELASWAWVGLSISYFLPDIKDVSKEDQDLGMTLRQRSVDFLELTDHVLQNTLKDLYPQLGDLVKYVSIEEIRSQALPAEEVLKLRQKHYIFFGFKIYTDREILDFAKSQNITIQQEVVSEDLSELTGQTAMTGKVSGRVRVLRQKAEIPLLEDGEILVTAMTTPDYLPAMHKASAFVTDEGGVTCHAAIVAREIGKPCIIGTKIATKLFKTGDMVEVDADSGVVKIIK